MMDLILGEVFDITSQKIYSKIDDKNKIKTKNEIKNKILEFDYVSEYKNFDYYNDLCKCISSEYIADKIISKCEKYEPNENIDTFVTNLISTAPINTKNQKTIHKIISNLINRIFLELNQINDESRMLLNYINRSISDLKVNNINTSNETINVIQNKNENSNYNLIMNHLSNNVGENVNITTKLKEGYYKIYLVALKEGLLSNFDDSQKYLEHLYFCGISDTIKIANYSVIDNKNNQIFNKEINCCYGNLFKFKPMFSQEFSILEISNNDVFITIKPEPQYLTLSIENDNCDIISNDLKFLMTRKILDDNKFITKLKYESNYFIIEFDFTVNVYEIIETKINIFNKNHNCAITTLNYYNLFNKLLTEKIQIRETKSQIVLMDFDLSVKDLNLSDVTKKIDILKKIIKIQDYFNLNFILGLNFDENDINYIEIAYSYITEKEIELIFQFIVPYDDELKDSGNTESITFNLESYEISILGQKIAINELEIELKSFTFEIIDNMCVYSNNGKAAFRKSKK